MNYSGLTGKNLIAALDSVGLCPILDLDGKVIGARSKPRGTPKPQTVVHMEVMPGELIDPVCQRAADLAKKTGLPHRFVLLGAETTVHPGDSKGFALIAWHRAYYKLPGAMQPMTVDPGSMGVVTSCVSGPFPPLTGSGYDPSWATSDIDWSQEQKPKPDPPPRQEPEILRFDYKRKIELEEE